MNHSGSIVAVPVLNYTTNQEIWLLRKSRHHRQTANRLRGFRIDLAQRDTPPFKWVLLRPALEPEPRLIIFAKDLFAFLTKFGTRRPLLGQIPDSRICAANSTNKKRQPCTAKAARRISRDSRRARGHTRRTVANYARLTRNLIYDYSCSVVSAISSAGASPSRIPSATITLFWISSYNSAFSSKKAREFSRPCPSRSSP